MGKRLTGLYLAPSLRHTRLRSEVGLIVKVDSWLNTNLDHSCRPISFVPVHDVCISMVSEQLPSCRCHICECIANSFDATVVAIVPFEFVNSHKQWFLMIS